MNPRTEIYEVRFNKYKTENGDTGFTKYTIGQTYMVGMVKFTPKRIVLIKDRIQVTFEDGCIHNLGFNNDVEIFKRPIVSEIPKKEIETETSEYHG
jgi:hypothetical protein